MALEPDAKLVVDRKVDVRTLPITPVDFFVFSRVEALGESAATVADVIAASGQPPEQAEQSLIKLLKLGALAIANSQPAARPRPPASNDDALRKRARDRKRELLAAQMRAAKVSPTTSEPRAQPSPAASEDSSLPTAHDQKPAEPGITLRPILDAIDPVGEDDTRLDRSVDLPIERQRRLLALRDRLRQVGHFEIFGLDPIDDPRTIRRAYHVISREFHPDSYFGKELGSFRTVLDDLFRRARSSYEFLLDAEQRRSLVEAHQAQIREQRERRLQAEQAERAAQAEQQRRAEAEQRAKQEQAEKTRAERERQRKQRLRERALAERHKQAAAHAEQAFHEREIGRHGTAATLFRLAHEEHPEHPDYQREWRLSLATARAERAEINFNQGREALAAGRVHEAAKHFAEAADAEPSLRNLSEAAAVVSEVDPAQARSFAMAALEALAQAQARGNTLDDRAVGNVHQACARAFLAAGQHATAREQAERAHQLLNNKHTRALLNSIKLP